MLADVVAPLVRLNTYGGSDQGSAWPLLICLAGTVALVIWLIRTQSASKFASAGQNYTETEIGGWFEITALPFRPSTPYAITALIPAAIAATALTALWIAMGHEFEQSAWVWWLGVLAGVVGFHRLVRERDERVRKIQKAPFAVTGGIVRLPTGGEILVTGQFMVTRRNSAPYGHSATAHAHHVDLDFGGRTYTLAGGMSDAQSMAVYHEVMRRLKGDP